MSLIEAKEEMSVLDIINEITPEFLTMGMCIVNDKIFHVYYLDDISYNSYYCFVIYNNFSYLSLKDNTSVWTEFKDISSEYTVDEIMQLVNTTKTY